MKDEIDFGSFLRSRRERLKPEDVGLKSSGRRRTPGLRREELATLAGVSVEYLERLEQGRDTNPSVAVLSALAEALQLSDDDKRHLANVVIKRQGAALLPRAHAVGDETRALRTLLDSLAPNPACLMGPSYDIRTWNPAYEMIMRCLGYLDLEPPNAARHHFTNPTAREIFDDEDWAHTADELVGWLRSAEVEWGDDADFKALIDELRAEPEFAQRWASHTISYGVRHGMAKVPHPDVGTLTFDLEVLIVGESNQWLQMWVPNDTRTRTAMIELDSLNYA